MATTQQRQRMTPARRRAANKPGRFRVLAGVHIDFGPKGCACGDCDGALEDMGIEALRHLAEKARIKLGPKEGPGALDEESIRKKLKAELTHSGADHIYEAWDPRRHGSREGYANDIMESRVDLVELHCQLGLPPKFERLDAKQEAPMPATYPLEKMTYAQLLAVAEEEEVDVKDAKGKEQVIKLLKESQAKPAAKQ